MTGNLREDASAFLSDLQTLRRDLHRHPEVGFDLPRTQGVIRDELERIPGLELSFGRQLTSVVGILRGRLPGPTVLLRADMDALPVREEVDTDYRATTGAMHACGHDLHVAALIGAARLLASRRDALAGSVVLMFQPGEEAGGGAPLMIQEGVLDAAGERVSAAYGIHVLPGIAGTFSTKPGSLMAGANVLKIRVVGQGGHGSRPHQAIDPVPVLAEITLALQTYVTTRVPVTDPIVVSVTKIAASETSNIIPDSASLEATVRTLSRDSVERLSADLPHLASHIAAAHGCAAEVEFRVGYPVTVNDDDAAERALTVLGATFGQDRVARLPDPIMASEDFAFVLNEVPGAYIFLGATPAELLNGPVEMNHSPRAQFDDAVLADQAAALAALALSHLAGRA